MPTSICPECTEEVYVDAETEQGDTVSCDECGAGLVVVGLDPIELDLKEEDEEGESVDGDGLDSYDFDDGRY
jgi:alpha-aminoadipate carrier protein LysW